MQDRKEKWKKISNLSFHLKSQMLDSNKMINLCIFNRGVSRAEDEKKKRNRRG